jgi:hypothetical protein
MKNSAKSFVSKYQKSIFVLPLCLIVASLLIILPIVRSGDAGKQNEMLVPGSLPLSRNEVSSSQKETISEQYGRLPLSFEINQGQTDSQVAFFSRTSDYSLFLTPTEAVLTLRKSKPASANKTAPVRFAERTRKHNDPEMYALRMRFVGANPSPEINGIEEIPGKSNYFIGNDPNKWRAGVSHFSKVKYEKIYPGIDVVYYGNQRQLEYDFVLEPGADLNQIRLAFAGPDSIRIDQEGDLVLSTKGGDVKQHKPLVYQEVDGSRKEIAGSYVMRTNGNIGFEIGNYDSNLPLVIDPTLAYSTFLGGSSNDFGQGIAVDAIGNAYVVGWTGSTDFPTTAGAFDISHNGVDDVFVAKLNPSGSSLLFSTFIGGSGNDIGLGIAIDAAGNSYLTGKTDSPEYPTTPGAFQTLLNGTGNDVFVTKLDLGGALVYSTLLGGSGASDTGAGIAVDGSGSVSVTGVTDSSDFPISFGAFDTSFDGGNEAFVTKLDPSGSALVYSTFLGGTSNSDMGNGIAVDGAGNAYVAGTTDSSDFPTTPGAFQTSNAGGFDAFIAKLNPSGSLAYSTLLGDVNTEDGWGIAVDASGSAYVTGDTSSPGFPTSPGAFDTSHNRGGGDVFVTKFDPTGSTLVYSTFLGGSDGDSAYGIAIDQSGNAYVTGFSFAAALEEDPNFPTTPDAFSSSNRSNKAFFAKLSASGSALVYSTFLGGASFNGPVYGIAVLPSGTAYLVGTTTSPDFPTTPGVIQTSLGDSSSSFVMKFADAPPTPTPTPQIGPPTNKDQCKNGGWQIFNTPREFKSQGDCVSFVNTGH